MPLHFQGIFGLLHLDQETDLNCKNLNKKEVNI